jgi:hypothetical protein
MALSDTCNLPNMMVLLCSLSCVSCMLLYLLFPSHSGAVGIDGNIAGLCVKKHDFAHHGDVQYLPSDVSLLGGSVLK